MTGEISFETLNKEGDVIKFPPDPANGDTCVRYGYTYEYKKDKWEVIKKGDKPVFFGERIIKKKVLNIQVGPIFSGMLTVAAILFAGGSAYYGYNGIDQLEKMVEVTHISETIDLSGAEAFGCYTNTMSSFDTYNRLMNKSNLYFSNEEVDKINKCMTLVGNNPVLSKLKHEKANKLIDQTIKEYKLSNQQINVFAVKAFKTVNPTTKDDYSFIDHIDNKHYLDLMDVESKQVMVFLIKHELGK